MPRFVSRPIEIQAIQYRCPKWTTKNKEPFWDDNSQHIEDWLWEHEPDQFKTKGEWDVPKDWWRWVDEGFENDGEYSIGHWEVYDYIQDTWVKVNRNDWIIQGTKGEYYPCADEVFKAKYEEIISGVDGSGASQESSTKNICQRGRTSGNDERAKRGKAGQ